MVYYTLNNAFLIIIIANALFKDIQINITKEDTGELIQSHDLIGQKGKFSFTINNEESGNYKICVKNHAYSDNHLKDVSIRLTINSDNMDDPDLTQTISKEDVNPVKTKLDKAIEKVFFIES